MPNPNYRSRDKCDLCGGDMSPNASGICIKCRTVECASCKTVFQKKASNLHTKYCSPCRQKKTREPRALT